jgi:Fe-S cluster assembly ATP-binding protein
MLTIKNLKVSIQGKTIIQDFNLQVNAGEVHAIMGPMEQAKARWHQ